MKYSLLQKLRDKLYFTVEDVAYVLGIKRGSSLVLCTRYAREGIFIRLKRDFYVLEEAWKDISNENLMKIANHLQVPSYVSFLTGLGLHGITTQVQNKFVESVSVKRSARYNVDGSAFNFHKLDSRYYFDFVKYNGIFLASPEKAFVDSIYLYSFGKYSLDLSAISYDKLDKKRLGRILKRYPDRTKAIVKRLCRI